MNLLYLKYFYEVARAGSVTEGSARLRVSQPAVSKMIRALEEDLGTKLLERRPRGVRLTAEGALAFEHAGRIFAEAQALGDGLRQNSPSLKGEWSLGASDTLAVHVLPAVLSQFKKAHPGLRISLFAGTSTHIKEEMLKDRCDLGIFITPPRPDEPFEATPCFATEFWIVASPKLAPKATSKDRTISFRDLKSLPRIESRHADYSTGFPANFHSVGLGLTEPPYLEVNNHEVKKRLVLAGSGYSLLIRESVQEEVRRGTLLRIKTPKPLDATIYQVTRRGRAMGRASREFLDLLKAR